MNPAWEGERLATGRAYHDLCASETPLERHTQLERALLCYKIGYGCVSFSKRATAENIAGTPASLAKTDINGIPAHLRVGPWRDGDEDTGPGGKQADLSQLSRITVVAGDAEACQRALSSRTSTTYDLVALEPTSERSFTLACTSLNVDIISLDASKRLPFRLKTALVKAALFRGVVFEVAYSSALRDPGSRRQFIANVQALARETRGQGIIVSSGARALAELRSPLDVINLATFLGLSKAQATAALTSVPAELIHRARSRRAHRSAVEVHAGKRLRPVLCRTNEEQADRNAKLTKVTG